MKKPTYLVLFLLSITSLSLAQKTYVPDNNFEQALIDLGYDDVLDDYVLTNNIDTITFLDIRNKEISSLDGIENFISLTKLFCNNNYLTNLNFSNNILLEYLSFGGNNTVENINITKNIALKSLVTTGTNFTSIDLSNNINLEILHLAYGKLTSLNVENNTKLITFFCHGNQLTDIDVSKNTKLELLAIDMNQITSIDISKNTALLNFHSSANLISHIDATQNHLLKSVSCSNNKLTSLNVKNGNNAEITNFWAENNPNLTCIQVDNAAWSTTNWTNIDPVASFSENCASTTGTDADGDGVDDGDDDFPNDPTKAFANYFPATGYGSLGFEDLWPGKGDYDFNDLVLDYRFTTITNSSNKVVQIVQTFVVKASGAALKNGFGFNLPDANAALVNNLNIIGCDLREGYVNLKSNGTESGQSKPTIIAFDNVFNLLPHPGSGVGVNTETASPFVPYDTLIITLTPNSLNYTMNDFSLETWNPFIIINGERGKEVHLIDNPPTDLANRSYFGTWEDKSNQGTGKYYRTSNGSPWAINIAEPFVWPIERIEIQLAYLHFLEWAISSGAVYPDWYKDFSGYRNNDKLYIQR